MTTLFAGFASPPLTYLGVAGVDERSASELVQVVNELGLGKGNCRALIAGVGFLMTHTGLTAVEPPSTRQLTLRQLSPVLRALREQVFVVVHYVPTRATDFGRDMHRMRDAWGEFGPDALQLNADLTGALPTRGELGAVEIGRPLILSVGRAAMGTGDESQRMARILGVIGERRDSLAGVLVDPSEGRGIGVDPQVHARIIVRISAEFPGLTVGVAGGFGPGTVRSQLTQIIEPHLCTMGSKRLTTAFAIDAQSGLRDVLDPHSGRDRFNVARARGYLEDAATAYQRYLPLAGSAPG